MMILFLCLAASLSSAAEFATWTPDRGGNGIRLDTGWRAANSNGVALAELDPSTDHFHRAAYTGVIERGHSGPVWLTVEFLDRGYAQIAVTPGAPMTRQWGTVRVNSGKPRPAVWRYDNWKAGQQIRIEGISMLRGITLRDDPPPRLEYAPLTEPAIRFRTPSQRVTTAAGDVQTPGGLDEALAGMKNLLPLLRALGFNGMESYVRWGFVERRKGVYDWSFYDAIVDELEKHGLQWFPMLLAGSGYALPEWFHDSPENRGFQCLEHGETHDVQTIFSRHMDEYARRFIAEFGKRYGGRKSLLGIRLGPSGDYGEAQYPARGPGYQWRAGHTHIGYWAGDSWARQDFRQAMLRQYRDLPALNRAWDGKFQSFDEVTTFLPSQARTPRQRLDFAGWYFDAMSRWCEQWAIWARESLPGAVIHQSSGGWGLLEVGTDYSFQARSMAKVNGGVRLTNESDNYPDNFSVTRMASSAARFYGAALGYEPGGFGSVRGVMARLYNAVTNGAEHLFYYHGNWSSNDQAIGRWLERGQLLDERAKPVIDVAAFYPDTALKLDDDVLRHRWASAFFIKVRAMRAEFDFDYASEQMIRDGALDRFKVLVFVWGTAAEKDVIEKVDAWVRRGGIVIYPPMPRGLLTTVEGDSSVCRRWQSGDTGQGKVLFYSGDSVPGEFYARYLANELRKMDHLRPAIREALRIGKPSSVYWSALENGKLALLNFGDDPAAVRLSGGRQIRIEPYDMVMP